MRRPISMSALLVALIAAGCSTTADDATTTTRATAQGDESTSTTLVTATQPVVSVDASFALGTVVFGEQGRVEVVNTGSQAGNVHGYWIAIHPFYLELPSAIVEVGQRITIAFDPEASPDALVQAAGLLPVIAASDGEVALYSNGNFGDPTAIVDYVEWGTGGHFRSTVAEAAGIWNVERIVPTSGEEGGLIVTHDGPPQLLGPDLSPLPAEG